MQKTKTQQFARFYLKDLKIKTSKFQSAKSEIAEIDSASSN